MYRTQNLMGENWSEERRYERTPLNAVRSYLGTAPVSCSIALVWLVAHAPTHRKGCECFARYYLRASHQRPVSVPVSWPLRRTFCEKHSLRLEKLVTRGRLRPLSAVCHKLVRKSREETPT